MALKQFANIEIKSFIRNERWRTNLFARFATVFFSLYCCVILALVSNQMGSFFENLGIDPFRFFKKYILFYFLFDLFLRTLFPINTGLESFGLLKTRIRKSTLINYVLCKSYLNLFNFFPWLFIIPFSIDIVLTKNGLTASLGFVIIFLAMLITNHYLSVLLKLLFHKYLLMLIIIQGLLMFGVFIIPEYYSHNFGEMMLTGDVLLLTVLALASVICVFLVRRLLVKKLYLYNSDIRASGSDFTQRWISNSNSLFFSDTMKFAWLEICLLLRNRRTRYALVTAMGFMFYFLFIVYNYSLDGITGIPLLAFCIACAASFYGNLLFSWESAFFDGLMVRQINFRAYTLAKYYVMFALSFLTFIPIVIFLIITQKYDVFIAVSLFVYALGPANISLLFFGSFNKARIDLSRSTFFNAQGSNALTIFSPFLIFIFPQLLYWSFSFIWSNTAALVALNIFSMCIIISHKYIINNTVVRIFLRRKYINLEGFRKLRT